MSKSDLSKKQIKKKKRSLLGVVGDATPLSDAFLLADDVLRQGVQGISDIITIPGLVRFFMLSFFLSLSFLFFFFTFSSFFLFSLPRGRRNKKNKKKLTR